MPLVRVQVRNEYGLGQPQLYTEVDREDPKAVLDGVAVAGLVGILRQLGDLAEFAAEVFHGLQEQVMSTSSRSHKLMVRLQGFETAFSPLEKGIMAQKSHLHFAYTAGTVKHPHLQNEQNQFIYGDLPHFVMDSYEECRHPPCLHLLDKFDSGGPGSCLKRYSDPTFFRRASTITGEGNVGRASKDGKARQSKTKIRRNRVCLGSSVSNHSDRTRSTSVQVDGHSVSPFDVRLKSDLGDRYNSFDSRTGSSYAQHVSNLNYYMVPEEREPKDSSFSSLRMHHNDCTYSASVDTNNGVAHEDFPQSVSQEKTGPLPSCVNWDEKTEKAEPSGQLFDHDETAEMLTENFSRDAQKKGEENFRSVDQRNFHFDNKDTTSSISGQNQPDDVESEPDKYMDALNTIESESETDKGRRIKKDVEHYSNSNDDQIQDGAHGLTGHYSEMQPSEVESCAAAYGSSNILTSSYRLSSFNHQGAQNIGHGRSSYHPGIRPSNMEVCPAAYSSSIIEMPFDKPNSVSSLVYAYEALSQMAKETSDMRNYQGMDFHRNDEILDGSNEESVVSSLLHPSSLETNPKSTSDQIICTSYGSDKSRMEHSGVQSVKFWTNGGLLGLEPSKPLDFSLAKPVTQESATRTEDDISPSNQSSTFNSDGDGRNPDKFIWSSKSIDRNSSSPSMSCPRDQDAMSNKKISWKFSPTEAGTNHKRYDDSHHSRVINDLEHSLKGSSAAIHEAEQTVTANVKATSPGESQSGGENASQVFGLSNGFLGSDFQRKALVVHDEKAELPSFRKTGVHVPNRRNHIAAYQTPSEKTFEENLGSGSPINSPCSSPPLQHMKISFQPINGFETSKLKLKLPNMIYLHGSSGDMLPSFQLVPESTDSRDNDSDSDDDTFCRSSSYISDDCLSHHSDSNSEQWESDDTPPCKDELCDTLHRISSTESASRSVGLGRTGNGRFNADPRLQSPYVETCPESGQSSDLPSLSTLNPLFEKEMKTGSDAKDLLESLLPKETTPSPPPLPPLQWRVTKSQSDVTTGKLDSMSNALNHAFDMKAMESTISPESCPIPVKPQQNTDKAITFTPKKPEAHKLNLENHVNQAINYKSIDEKEDFLHQIRTKSFSLRRTVTEKQTDTPAHTASDKVVAILVKANAIRQAVGSDDCDDEDGWSEA
ncbi:protein SCAR3 isoform X2 [Diospyros lotus]|uniref:protein SCAR3 isoform X2 n=1 Tax=Diospyros lotus TaxID=55363 RepID=UPI002258DAC5|nr:protein SCAR3 isoform X2 [Diospyros lotus]